MVVLLRTNRKERKVFVESLNHFVDKALSGNGIFGTYPPQMMPELPLIGIFETYAQFIMNWINFDLPSICSTSVFDNEIYGNVDKGTQTMMLDSISNTLSSIKEHYHSMEPLKKTIKIALSSQDGRLSYNLRSVERSANYLDWSKFHVTFPLNQDPEFVAEIYTWYHMKLYNDICASDLMKFYQLLKNSSCKITNQLINECKKGIGTFIEKARRLRGQIQFTISEFTPIDERVQMWIKIYNSAYNKFGNYFLCDAIESEVKLNNDIQISEKTKKAYTEFRKHASGTQFYPEDRLCWIPETTNFCRRLFAIAECELQNQDGIYNLEQSHNLAEVFKEFLKGQGKQKEVFHVDKTYLDHLDQLSVKEL